MDGKLALLLALLGWLGAGEGPSNPGFDWWRRSVRRSVLLIALCGLAAAAVVIVEILG